MESASLSPTGEQRSELCDGLYGFFEFLKIVFRNKRTHVAMKAS